MRSSCGRRRSGARVGKITKAYRILSAEAALESVLTVFRRRRMMDCGSRSHRALRRSRRRHKGHGEQRSRGRGAKWQGIQCMIIRGREKGGRKLGRGAVGYRSRHLLRKIRDENIYISLVKFNIRLLIDPAAQLQHMRPMQTVL